MSDNSYKYTQNATQPLDVARGDVLAIFREYGNKTGLIDPVEYADIVETALKVFFPRLHVRVHMEMMKVVGGESTRYSTKE